MPASAPSMSRSERPQHTLRSLTGAEIYPPSPPLPLSPDRRYSRHNISIFRAASGEERHISPPLPRPTSVSPLSALTPLPTFPTCSTSPSSPSSPSSSPLSPLSPASSRSPTFPPFPPFPPFPTDSSVPFSSLSPASPRSSHTDQSTAVKPRISSVTDSSAGRSRDDIHVPLRRSLPDVEVTPLGHVDNDDAFSTYSHASAVDLDVDTRDFDALQLDTYVDSVQHESPSFASRHMLDSRRQSFANSFLKAREQKNRRALVLAHPKMPSQNQSVCLVERCVRALTETLDQNLVHATCAIDKFRACISLFTEEERQVISDLLREASTRLRSEAPTPWRSPLRTAKRVVIRGALPQTQSANQISGLFRAAWGRRQVRTVSSDTLVRSVVFGSHVVPGIQSAESILLRMAGEYHREEVTRRTTRAERLDLPLSFAMSLTAALATFARLDCYVSFSRYRCRSASNRRSTPHALLYVKTRYDGTKLSFGVILHGEAPCTIMFRRPRIFSLRRIEDYATLVTEAMDIMAEFGREVVAKRKM